MDFHFLLYISFCTRGVNPSVSDDDFFFCFLKITHIVNLALQAKGQHIHRRRQNGMLWRLLDKLSDYPCPFERRSCRTLGSLKCRLQFIVSGSELRLILRWTAEDATSDPSQSNAARKCPVNLGRRDETRETRSHVRGPERWIGYSIACSVRCSPSKD